ncbi:hypothetical protein ACJRO7_026113 [Eucalyptus globulus]|uniref:Uncharacterized protein n=1 Tax=Eucalyptus globulus TaxID=34317 RepID=A0ABD3KGK8_EUCGL
MGDEANGVEGDKPALVNSRDAESSCLRSGKMSNGFANGHDSDVAEGSSGGSECVRTYKRRKQVKLESKSGENERATAGASTISANQISREPIVGASDFHVSEQLHVPSVVHHAVENGCDEHSQSQCSSIVLEHIFQSLSDQGGIGQCIQNALARHAREIDNTKAKDTQLKDQHRLGTSTQAAGVQNGIAANGADLTSKASMNGSNHEMITESSQRAFYNIIVSGKFSQLCKLLCENFPETKIDRVLDFRLINSRMKEGAYEQSQLLFSSDILQVWRKLEEIGTGLASLAKSLTDISKEHCKYGANADKSYSDGGKFVVSGKDALVDAKLEQTEECGAYNGSTCRHCELKADGMECLVCDSCEEIYHVSCIEPAVKEIPPRSWYCASCTESGITSPHENCVVCERLNASRSAANGFADEEVLTTLEDANCSSDLGINPFEETKISSTCKICGNEIENGDKFRMCEHPFCPNKYYHRRCLTTKQLKSYSSRWYCPSCLCRGCLTDRDDDKIVLCDGCDQAYHIYCMKPPRTSIPRGKWFCRKCDAGIQAIRRAKKAYENFENKQRKKVVQNGECRTLDKKPNENGEEDADKGRGGMDMLLIAANTLNDEEKLAGVEMDS